MGVAQTAAPAGTTALVAAIIEAARLPGTPDVNAQDGHQGQETAEHDGDDQDVEGQHGGLNPAGSRQDWEPSGLR